MTDKQLEDAREAHMAFRRALDDGLLSRAATAANYANNYMYMGTDADGRDLFKHQVTREYLA